MHVAEEMLGEGRVGSDGALAVNGRLAVTIHEHAAGLHDDRLDGGHVPGRLIKASDSELPVKLRQAAARLSARCRTDAHGSPLGAILLMVDGDGESKKRQPELARRAAEVGVGWPIATVLPARVFENWIVAGAGTLRGIHGLPDDLPECDDPETVNALDWLRDQLRRVDPSRGYRKVADAVPLVTAMDLEAARRASASFARLVEAMEAWATLAASG